MADPNPAARQFLDVVAKKAKGAGIEVIKIECIFGHLSTENMARAVRNMSRTYDGVVVQLPLPNGINKWKVLCQISVGKDPDLLSPTAQAMFKEGGFSLLPPVTGAVKAILRKWRVNILDQGVFVVGDGALVGQPTALWARREGARVTVLDKESFDHGRPLKDADIIVSGTGVAHLIKPEMIKSGVVIIDAGTSFKDGKVCGDVDPLCKRKASYVSPVPGGVGPATVGKLLQNLIDLKESRGV